MRRRIRSGVLALLPALSVAAVLAVFSPIVVAGSPVAQSSPATSTVVACSTLNLVLANPSSGDVLSTGDYVVVGQAFDTSALQPPGVDRIQAFFDRPREQGGQLAGEVIAGQATYPESLTATGFALLVTVPNTPADNNTHTLFVYARSQQTGAEQVVSVTVQVEKPLAVGAFTPTPTPPPTTIALIPCGSPTPTPTFPPFPAPTAGATPGVTASLTLRVANPSPGDNLSAGEYVFQGLAFDPLAQGASGVDRVSIFLDPREQGGQFLGDAMLGPGVPQAPFGYQLTAALPNRKGGHLLTVYAHSSITGQEASISVPISIR